MNMVLNSIHNLSLIGNKVQEIKTKNRKENDNIILRSFDFPYVTMIRKGNILMLVR